MGCTVFEATGACRGAVVARDSAGDGDEVAVEPEGLRDFSMAARTWNQYNQDANKMQTARFDEIYAHHPS